MYRRFLYILLVALSLISCGDKVPESQIAAQVGNSVLLLQDVRMQIPLGATGADSANFAREYISDWIDSHVMYEQGLRTLPDLDILNRQVEDYRRDLIAQHYENELLRLRVSEEISDQDIEAFYEKYSKQLKLEQPIVQGVFIKLLRNTSRLDQVRRWLKSLNDGNTDCMADLDEQGNMRAADYENFYDTWIDFYSLSDKLPETVVDAASFLKCKTYEMSDDEYYYMFVIKDYRLTGEISPLEYTKADIYEILIQQRRHNTRLKLIEDLKEEGLKTGFIKIND